MNIIKNIIRYPIKGLSGEYLDKALLEVNQTIPGDREFAFARFNTKFDQNNPVYLRKTNFLALVKEEKLAKLSTVFNAKSKQFTIKIDNNVVVDEYLTNKKNINKVEIFFQDYLGMSKEEKPRLVQGIKTNKANPAHSFSDIPDKAISIINLNTVLELQNKLGKQISPSRFRGNILVDGVNAWEEFNWIGKKIYIGDAILEVFKRTQRCAATNVNPDNGQRDINIPNEIKSHYGHLDLGIYARVTKGGLISILNKLHISD